MCVLLFGPTVSETVPVAGPALPVPLTIVIMVLLLSVTQILQDQIVRHTPLPSMVNTYHGKL
jgi:hypothetical protein